MVIRVLGLETDASLEELSGELEEVFGMRFLVGPFLEVPPGSFNPSRRQYDANVILDRLLSRIPGRFLAVTSVDLYTSSSLNLNFIFGQAQCPGRGAVVSTHRLDPSFYGAEPDPGLFFERLVKESVHELGHTFGLLHCPNPRCVMSFSNSVLDVDRKGRDFCSRCRQMFKNSATL